MGFDGITGYVNCGNGASLNLTTTISVECLINSKSFSFAPPGGAVAIFGKWLANDGWLLGWYGAQKFYLYVKKGFGVQSTAYTYYPQGWLHIVATYTGGAATGKMYVNGVDVTGIVNALALTNPAANLTVGSDPTPAQFNRGMIACARVYDRILSLTEVNYNMNHPNNPKRNGCVLNLTQESLFGGQWKDLSGNANHGTLSATGVGPIPSNLIAGRNVSL